MHVNLMSGFVDWEGGSVPPSVIKIKGKWYEDKYICSIKKRFKKE